jgi:hypothetical protein
MMPKPFPMAAPAAPGSLASALAAVPDPRHPYGWRPDASPIPLLYLLQFVVAATLCGARSLYAMAQWGRERLVDNPQLLLDLGFPPGRSPCVATLHRVFKALDVGAFEAALQSWLLSTGVEPDEPVAVDGKALRGIHGESPPGVGLVAVYAQRSEAVLTQLRSGGAGSDIEATRAVLSKVPLEGRVVTADALVTQREVCKQIVAQKGDYLFPVKENQPALHADIEAAFSPTAAKRTRRSRRTGGTRVVHG